MAPSEPADYVPLAALKIDAENNDELQHEPKRPSTLWQRLGPLSLVTLLLGSAILPLVMLLLGLVWKESMVAATGHTARAPWIRIFSANWTTTLVTVCTALIRTVMAFQASLATAMLAAIIIESIGTPLLQAPFFSIIRALEVGPMNLLSAVRFRPKGALSFSVYALIVVQVLAIAASQFLSAMLVSDFKPGTFANVDNSTDVPIVGGGGGIQGNPWASAITSAWTFAERAEPPATGPDFHDSGHSYRAFLPFDDEARRTRLRSFDGPALLVDHRVVCARPSLTNLTLIIDDRPLRLSGQMAMNFTSFPMLRQSAEAPQHLDFSCLLPYPGSETVEFIQGETSLCAPRWRPSHISMQDPLDITESSTLFLLLDIVSPGNLPIVLGSGNSRDSLQAARANGSWALASYNSRGDALRITACLTHLDTKPFIVDMSRSEDGSEPRLAWDQKAKSFNTGTVRRLLGASTTPESPGKRGLMTMAPRSQWKDFRIDSKKKQPFGSFYNSMSPPRIAGAGDTDDAGVFLSRRNQAVNGNAHGSHSLLFQDALRDTDSPALALQAVLAMVCQTTYYDRLVIEENSASASTSFSSTTLIPMRWTGFMAATAIVATHLVVVVIVTVLFFHFTSSSLLGNCWQAVAQVVTEDTLPILEQADAMKDKEVERWAKGQSLHRKRYGLVRNRRTGQTGLDIGRENAEREGEETEQTERA
ncbi:hypothetical protein G6O67_007847 [Ophiocordyceps sinensis]|uniref:Uncharacterized protein n=1 Tax=Ophiocordyceps sinensis TaxID=72228 RepID=A0A8H4LW63_9HYPO|nr:hypothetical protein G6O67_007847 [Ophiocordyceps sinensis]